MAQRSMERLGSREREIINAIFALDNRATAEDIRARLTDPPSSSSVRVMLTRLERKGYVRHRVDGPRYLYSALRSPSAASRAALRQYVQTFFRGSVADLVTALVRHEKLSDGELDTLAAEIEKAKRTRGGREG